MKVRDFLNQLADAKVLADKAWQAAVSIYGRVEVEPVMKELYPDFNIPADKPEPAPAAKPEPVDVNGAIRAERKRAADIKASGEALKVKAEIVEKAIDDGISLSDAALRFVDAVKAGNVVIPSQPQSIQVGAEDAQKFHNLAVDSIMDTAGMLRDPARRAEIRGAGAEFAPRSLHGLIRNVLVRKGVRGVENMEPAALVDQVFKNASSQGTGSFTNILSNVANKSLEQGREMAPTTFRVWTKDRPVKDFREMTAASLSAFSDVEVIPENAAPKHGSFSDKSEKGTLRTSGKLYTIPRPTIINDDLGAFTAIPRAMGNAIECAQEKELLDYMYGTTSYGPTMNEDSGTMFNATAVTSSGGHANLTTSGGAPSKTTLAVGLKAIMTAPRAKGNPKDAAYPTGAMPRFFVVPPSLLAEAWILVSSAAIPTTSYSAGAVNPYAAGGLCPLQIVCPAYLEALDANGWYLFTDPNVIGTFSRLTLLGKESPTLTQAENQGESPLGITYTIFYDWRWMADDWRGAYCNDGE